MVFFLLVSVRQPKRFQASGRHVNGWQTLNKEPGPDLLTAAPEAQYFEWHQVYKIGERYVMLLEGYNGGKRWGPDVAISASLASGWKKLSISLIDQTTWPGYSDDTEFHVATPAIYQINGKWLSSCRPLTRALASFNMGRCIALSSMTSKRE